MSDGDVSLIRDEDLLRRMWQQTEDFSRKKEIRAHMYRLREERLRNLYSPEPGHDPSKGCEFSSTQGHVKSFADQTFQSMKSKEVRDAGSPPKEFTYRGQDLKDLSNAGWNVESENKTTDDGRTRVKSVNANIEGRYDVDGGKGHFAAADHHRQAVTEYDDGNTSLKRNEDYTNTSARERVVRQTEDGTHFISTSNTSSSASKFEQISSTQDIPSYQINDNYDLDSQTLIDTNRNEENLTKTTQKTSGSEDSLRSESDGGELVSKKIEYPDDNTKVIVETRCLPDGTRVTSTRREFRAPSVQTRRTEYHSEQTNNGSKSTSYNTYQKQTKSNEISRKIIHDSNDSSVKDIVDSQRIKDDVDFGRKDIIDYDDNQSQHSYRDEINKSVNSEHRHESIQRKENETTSHEDVIRKTQQGRENSMKKHIYAEEKIKDQQSDDYYNSNVANKSNINDNVRMKEHVQTIKKDYNRGEQSKIHIDETNKPRQPNETNISRRSDDIPFDSMNSHPNTQENRTLKTGDEYTHNIIREREVQENSEKKCTREYETTYQTDYSQRKITSDLSPTHQAWASTLRSDTPPRSTTRALSPCNKNYKSSTSLRSSVSPDKVYRKTPTRVGSPNKIDRFSPTRTFSDKTFSSTHSSTYSIQESKKSNKHTDGIETETPKNKSTTRRLYSPERNLRDNDRERNSVSPEKQTKLPFSRSNTSPQRKNNTQRDEDRDSSPMKKVFTRKSPSPETQKRPIEKYNSSTIDKDDSYNVREQIDTFKLDTKHSETDVECETSIDIKNKVSERPQSLPSYMRPTESSSPKNNHASSPTKSAPNDRKSPVKHLPSSVSHLDKVKEEQIRFIKEENKTNTIIETISNNVIKSSSEFNNRSPRTSPSRNNEDCIQSTVNINETTPTRSGKSPQKDFLHTTIDDKVVERSEHWDQDTKSEIKNQDVLSKPSNKNIPEAQMKHPNKPFSRESSPAKRNKSSDKDVSKPRDKIISNVMPEIGKNENVCKNRSLSPKKIIISPSTELTQLKQTVIQEKNETQTSISSIIDIENKENKRSDDTITERNKEIFKKHTDNNDNLRNEEKTPYRGSPRLSVSPTKSNSDIKNKQTLDFIAAEKHSEEINKSIAKNKPRNLSTPSTSPTRQLKSEDMAPSTGLSSPTTESGFVYYSTKNEKPLITDLDFSEDDSKAIFSIQKPIDRTTKIPCRSPSPEKVINKENLPRKSSLKKPSIDNGNSTSPKPPTTFLISPSDENKEILRDETEKNSSKPIKIKPPLERRETYEERCRKILGMMDDTTVDIKSTETKSASSISPDVSPSISPCESPVHEDKALFVETNEVVGVIDVSDRTPSKSENQEIISKEVDQKKKQTISTNNISKSTQPKNIEKKSPIDSSKPSSLPKEEQLNKKTSLNIPQDQIKPSPQLAEPQKSVEASYKTHDFRDKLESDLNTSETTNNQTLRERNIKKDSMNSTETHKKINKCSEFILTEKEQQILDRVQSSLRKLSPDRKGKPTEDINFQKPQSMLPTPIDKSATEIHRIQEPTTTLNTSTTVIEDNITLKNNLTDKSVSKSQIPSKPSSRNTSPVKKPSSPPSQPKNTNEAVKPRSTSPKIAITPADKKQGSHTERPQSPQINTAAVKTKELYQRASFSSTIKKEKSDSKKTITKTQSTTKVSPTKAHTPKITSDINNKTQNIESKRMPSAKGTHSSIFKKEIDSKVTRTSSDIGIKSPVKKISPQRMKSKPEIHLNNVTTNKIFKHTTATTIKQPKSTTKEIPTKLPVSKPKSATALNTSIDDDVEIIIDVQLAKSSRENTPDRICPTPVGFSDDIGTPRFPDEVNEPDDEVNKRSHNVIHEVESIVDDIVEICEDDELFVKSTETEQQVHNVMEKTVVKDQKSKHYNLSEKKVHHDEVSENLKSDECLLSVSEKVNKFAKGPANTKDKSPSRNIKEDYDRDTIYTDDYTKLSVNDKAHLFIETAENVKTTKHKSVPKPKRPDLSNVDESLKSDECLLSVSDKVTKFVKTAEHVLSDTYSIDEKDKRIKEEHEKIMRQIVDDVDDDKSELVKESPFSKNKKPLSIDTTHDTPHHKIQKSNKIQAGVKQCNKPTPIKITSLRSNEAVKKAKALFENIASVTEKESNVHNKSTKLSDIGVPQKAAKPRAEAKKPVQSEPTIQTTYHDEQQNQEKSSSKQELSEITQITSSVLMEDKLSLNRASSPTFRGKSPVKRPISPLIKENNASNRTLSPMSREKSPLPKLPLARDKSPVPRMKSPSVREGSPTGVARAPVPQTATITPKKRITRYPMAEESDSSKPLENKEEKVPGYQRATKTSQMKEEKGAEEIEVSSRRGSAKFGVELRRTSTDRCSVSSERRRSSVEHHQPCIEDIHDLDLLEQMLEKVIGYEQRRRIRAQIRVAKKKLETEETTRLTKIMRQSTVKVTKGKSPERLAQRSPERPLVSQTRHTPEQKAKPNKATSPDRQYKPSPYKSSSPQRHAQLNSTTPHVSDKNEPHPSPLINGYVKEDSESFIEKTESQCTDKSAQSATKSMRPSSPDKRRPLSPSKLVAPKAKSHRFSEYASAYMKKVGLKESDKVNKHHEANSKRASASYEAKRKGIESSRCAETHHVTTTIDRTLSKNVIEVRVESKSSVGEKSLSPDRSRLPDESLDSTQQPRNHSPERISSAAVPTEVHPGSPRKPSSPRQSPFRQPGANRSPSPDTKKSLKKETIIKTRLDVGKKVPQKQEDKPSWVTSRNLKKVTSETRTFSSKKIETEKPRYRAPSASKVISKPVDVITSSYGPGPLDAQGRPLFGIKALRNGATNYQVKGAVVRQEFHSRHGGEPEGTVSVTAYSTEPADLELLLRSQGEKPSRLHGLAAITATRKFGGDTGSTLSELASKEERAALDQFTHSNRRVTEGLIEDSHQGTQRESSERVSSRSDAKRQEQTQSSNSAQSSAKSQRESRTEKMQKAERRVEDRKPVRQSSVKSLTEKFIKNASESAKSERVVYPKAGLILRTAGMKDSVSSDSSAHAGLDRTDSDHSLASVEDTMTTTTTTTEQVGDVVRTTTTTMKSGGRAQERSFLDSSTKVSGVQDILARMRNADIVIEDGDTNEDSEARALLNKFLGASVLMAGMQSYVAEGAAAGQGAKKSCVRTVGGDSETDIEQCWDERVLRRLLDACTDYEQRRRLRARIRTLMAEQEACASAVTDALAAAGETMESIESEEQQQTGEREEEEVTTVTSSVRRKSSEQTVSSTTVTSCTVSESTSRPAPKPVSPFAKFRQLEKQHSTNSPNSPKTPQSPGSPSQPFFKFTDPALQLSAVTIKERLLQWCRDKTRDYENVKLENFSTSWADGLAFCALLHRFLPDAFDYSQLAPDNRRHNFTLAFKVADEKAGIYPLLDVDDMVAMRKPDWKCVFTYVQSIYRRFKDEL